MQVVTSHTKVKNESTCDSQYDLYMISLISGYLDHILAWGNIAYDEATRRNSSSSLYHAS